MWITDSLFLASLRPWVQFLLLQKKGGGSIGYVKFIWIVTVYFFLILVLKNGMYCSLYEVVEKTRIGSNMESLLQNLEKDKLVSGRGFLNVSSLKVCRLVNDHMSIWGFILMPLKIPHSVSLLLKIYSGTREIIQRSMITCLPCLWLIFNPLHHMVSQALSTVNTKYFGVA